METIFIYTLFLIISAGIIGTITMFLPWKWERYMEVASMNLQQNIMSIATSIADYITGMKGWIPMVIDTDPTDHDTFEVYLIPPEERQRIARQIRRIRKMMKEFPKRKLFLRDRLRWLTAIDLSKSKRLRKLRGIEHKLYTSLKGTPSRWYRWFPE